MTIAKDLNIVVCGIVRNAEKGLRRNMPVIDKVLAYFNDYRVLIYENDSVDATKDLLLKWQKANNGKVIASLNQTDSSQTIPSAKSVPGVNPFFCHKRIDKMARLRNNYMDMLSEYIDNDSSFAPDYMMVVDLDVAQLNAEAIMTSFNAQKDWDAVCAFGYSTSPYLRRRYHDTYALILWGEKDEPQTEKKIKNYASKFGTLKPTDEWIRIASGFGGVAIYKYEAIKGLRYAVPALLNYDSRVEVKCEHFSLYKQIIERGYDRFYINPAMVLKYQDLTLKIIWNSFKRMISK